MQGADGKLFLIAKVTIKVFFGKILHISGVAGACKKGEMTLLHVQYVKEQESYFNIIVTSTKTKTIREHLPPLLQLNNLCVPITQNPKSITYYWCSHLTETKLNILS